VPASNEKLDEELAGRMFKTFQQKTTGPRAVQITAQLPAGTAGQVMVTVKGKAGATTATFTYT
jgi:hypothetical protein